MTLRNGMKWALFTGTWRLVNAEVERDVRAAVRKVFAEGSGVLTGGATGVDYFAMDEAFQIDPSCRKLRIILPTSVEEYLDDCALNWCQAPVTQESILALGALLLNIRDANPASVLELPYHNIEQKHYDLRNVQEVMYAHEVYAFHVNHSTGTQHTIDTAVRAGLPLMKHCEYVIVE